MHTTILKRNTNDGLYYFPDFTQNVLNRVSLGTPVFLTGPSGTGKTEFVEYLAQAEGKKLHEIDFSVGTTESNIVGRLLVENGETIFYKGLLPEAMINGDWLLLDEIDFAEPEHLAILQQVLMGKPLIITQNKSEVITPHPDFRIFATANTKGRGDETQSYTGTNVLNISFIDRFSIFEFDYTKKEATILKDMLGDDELAKRFIELFKLFRKAMDQEEIINAIFSTRRLIQIAKLFKLGETFNEVVDHEIINRFEKSEKGLIKEYIFEIFDKEHYYKGWKLGDPHFVQPIAPTSEEEQEEEL